MLGSRKFKLRRIFAYHGLLVLAVLATAYLSVRAQYEAMRDQQLQELRADQQQLVRSAAQRAQQDVRLLLASLTTLVPGKPLPAWAPINWLSALATVDAATGKVIELRQGTEPEIGVAVQSLPALNRLQNPLVGIIKTDRRCDVTLAVPSITSGQVAVAVLSAEQISLDLSGTASGGEPTRLMLTTDQGLILAASASVSIGQWVQSVVSDSLREKINTFYGTTTAGSDAVETDDYSVVAQQPLEIVPGTRWYVVSVRSHLREGIRLKLRPLFWQLLSQASLTVIAMGVVLISTTVQMLRGRRRIEKLRADMLNRDLEKARRIQLNWLPAPIYKGERIAIAAENRPALHISGDFYNWFDLPPDDGERTRRTVVVIGDVSGHGMPAAFLMATTQLMVRNTIPNLRDPGLCLNEVNRQLCTLVYNGQFVTMMILVIDYDNNAVQIASAGHHPPLLRRDGVVDALPVDPQLVLGVDDSIEYVTERLPTLPGDLLLLFTDGAIEAADASGQQFGAERLREALRTTDDEPNVVLREVTDRLAKFHGGVDLDDDLTLLVLKLTEENNVASEKMSTAVKHPRP